MDNSLYIYKMMVHIYLIIFQRFLIYTYSRPPLSRDMAWFQNDRCTREITPTRGRQHPCVSPPGPFGQVPRVRSGRPPGKLGQARRPTRTGPPRVRSDRPPLFDTPPPADRTPLSGTPPPG